MDRFIPFNIYSMEDKVFSLIRMLSIPNEIVIDIELSIGRFNTIEIVDDMLVLHTFEDDFQTSYYFEDLEIVDQKKIYDTLSRLLYN